MTDVLLWVLAVLGFACGFRGYAVAKMTQDELRQLRDEVLPDLTPAKPVEERKWLPRVSPQRYLEAFPEGIHAEQAREIVRSQGGDTE